MYVSGRLIMSLSIIVLATMGSFAVFSDDLGAKFAALACLWMGGILTGFTIAHWDDMKRRDQAKRPSPPLR